MRFNELMMDTKRSGMRLGRYMDRVAHVRRLRNRYYGDELAERCFVTSEQLQAILKTIDDNPDWDDEQIAEYVDFE